MTQKHLLSLDSMTDREFLDWLSMRLTTIYGVPKGDDIIARLERVKLNGRGDKKKVAAR